MKRLVAVLAFAAAACEPEAPAPAVEAAAPVAAAPTAPELFTVAAGQTTFPAPLVGRWDGSAEACAAERADVSLIINGTSMTFWKIDGVVTAMTPAGPNTMDVDGKFTGEGNKQWDDRLHMQLSPDAKSLTIAIGSNALTRVKCP